MVTWEKVGLCVQNTPHKVRSSSLYLYLILIVSILKFLMCLPHDDLDDASTIEDDDDTCPCPIAIPNASQSPTRPTDFVLHRHLCQSVPCTIIIALQDFEFIRGININGHLQRREENEQEPTTTAMASRTTTTTTGGVEKLRR